MRMFVASRWLFIIVILVIKFAKSNAHVRIWHVDVPSPCDIMVDVVNNIGLNILKVHNLNNENNIALSPYGTVSILTALLEGVEGSAQHEIQECGGFPANRDIVRIGLRDIHRLLRTYFIPREGFLSGLSLSTETVVLKSEYLSILRFYGYDMTNFNTPIYSEIATTTPMTSVTETTMPSETEVTYQTEKREDEEITTTKMSTIKTTLPEITLPQSTVKTTLPETVTITMTTEELTTMRATTNPTVTETQVPTVTELPPTTTIPSTLPVITTQQPVATITETTLTPTTTEGLQTTTYKIESTFKTTTSIIETTTQTKESTIKPDKSKRSIVNYLIPRYRDSYSPDLTRYNTIEHINSFLVNGKFPEAHAQFMTYETVLPFYYIPDLNALALRFPLDSPKYYLLLILPVNDDSIDRIICDIGNAITLKQIISHLRPTFVRAVIPNFTLRGLVTLTSSLQKIGIKQIFEPYRADFSPLTNDTNVYVTNIEQAITVIIKNYMDMDVPQGNDNRNLYHEEPVDFKATHPFLYFVMDSEIDVALIAGKIVNPINSRIQ